MKRAPCGWNLEHTWSEILLVCCGRTNYCPVLLGLKRSWFLFYCVCFRMETKKIEVLVGAWRNYTQVYQHMWAWDL
jgi:hypothetical protein